MLRILTTIILLLVSAIPGHGETVEDIGNLHIKADGMTVSTRNASEEEMKKKAQETYKYIQSREFQDRISSENEKVRKQFKEQINQGKPKQGGPEAVNKETSSPGDERIYVFISSSIPRATLRNYVVSSAGLKNENISFILRGFIGNDKGLNPIETQRFINELLKVNPSCSSNCEYHKIPVFVDPRLFNKYGIDKVPAVVRSTGGIDMLSDAPGTGKETEESASVIYGDASLEELIRKVKEN